MSPGRAALLACSALLLATPAFAQPRGAPADAQSAARTRAEEGLRLFKDGRWEEAYGAFDEANRLFHAPTLVAYMGTCRRNQGRLVEARALYDQVLAEPVPKNAPEAFKKAIDTARVETEKLRGRIPYIKVHVTGSGAEKAKVTVDGVVVNGAELTAGRAVDPGEHQVAAEAPGAGGKATAVVKEGDAITVEVKLDAGGALGARGSLVPAGIAFGVGGAGLLTGILTAVVATTKISAAQEGCTPPDASGVQHCPAGNQASASAARGLIAGSVVGFVVAGAGAVTGIVLAVVRPGGGPAQVAVDVGPGFVGLRGRF